LLKNWRRFTGTPRRPADAAAGVEDAEFALEAAGVPEGEDPLDHVLLGRDVGRVASEEEIP